MQIPRSQLLILGALAAAMALTRLPMTASVLHLQDASWAVFFLAGFFLSAQWRWAFPTLMAVAVAVDYTAIRYFGIPNYCVTVAYWFLVLSFAVLWLAGTWLHQRLTFDLRGALAAAASLVVSVSLCYLISNGSFYWLGDRVEPSWNGWMANLGHHYWSFLKASLIYVTAAVILYLVGMQLAGNAERVRSSG